MPDFKVEDVDFDAAYQAGAALPWVIGRPQRLVVDLSDAGEITGDVLDVGCGAGDNAIFLTSRGHTVTAIDGSATVIEQARAKSQAVNFVVGDATELAGLTNEFDTVVDSALYHCLSETQRLQYMRSLHRATRPGARLHLICFAEQLQPPFRVTEANLRETVGTAFTITSLTQALYESSMSPDGFAQAAQDISPGSDVRPAGPEGLQLDEDGRILFPVWQLKATRND